MKPQEFHDSRRYASTSHGDVAYVRRGDGPAALFIHGAPLNGFQWRAALEGLQDIRSCIAVDSIGLGYSRVSENQEVTPDAQAAMLEGFLDLLDIDRIDLVGNDSGGGIAQVFTARCPERVRSLALTNCEIGDYETEVGDQFMGLVETGGFTQMLREWLADPSTHESLWALGYERPQEIDPAVLRVYIEPLLSSPERVQAMERYLTSFNPAYTRDAAEALQRLDIPVMILWGLADTFFSKHDARWLRDRLSNILVYEEIPEAKLFFPEERPKVFVEYLRRFWQLVGAEPA